MFSDDSGGLLRLDIRRVVAQLEHAAEQYDVRAREHVQQASSAANRHVIHSRVGREVDELPFGRHQRCVVEQLRRAEAAAVEDKRLVQGQHIRAVLEVADYKPAARNLEVRSEEHTSELQSQSN